MIYVVADEKTAPLLTGTLLDDAGDTIDPADVSSVKFTLYNLDDSTKSIINTRSAVEVLNGAVGSTDEFTISAQGVFEFVFTTADTVLVGSSNEEEVHRFEFELGYVDASARPRVSVIKGNMSVTNRLKVT